MTTEDLVIASKKTGRNAFVRGAATTMVFRPRAKLVMADAAAYSSFAEARETITRAARTAERVVGKKLLTVE